MLKLPCRYYELLQQSGSSNLVAALCFCLKCVLYPAHRSNKLMISAGADKLLKVWDVTAALAANPTGQSSKAVPSLKATAATSAHDKDINAVAVAPNDSLICTTSQDRTAKVMQLPLRCKYILSNIQRSLQSSLPLDMQVCKDRSLRIVWYCIT